MANFLEVLQRERVVVVIRGAQAATLSQTIRALYEGGLRIFEITVETANAINAFSNVREQLPQDALLGVGTVLDPGTAALAVAAGAEFVVSPILLADVCRVARAHGVPCMLGGMTPTEIHAAYQYGCEAVKVFPASTVGAAFIRELRGPLRFIPLYPTGGITLNNAVAFLEAGAIAVGVGSALVKKEWVQRSNWEALQQAAGDWAKLRHSG
ncbi:MAG: bifunctional 4-hydroxy-2-oxoglutarate aldolase/2-dehydro-3-deoxy-phosphogluconate aldolase [Ktedonobacteraceae bacterium]